MKAVEQITTPIMHILHVRVRLGSWHIVVMVAGCTNGRILMRGFTGGHAPASDGEAWCGHLG